MEYARAIMETVKYIKDAIENIPDLFILGMIP